MDSLQKKILAAVGVILVLTVLAAVIVSMNRPTQKAGFTPPPFEENAVAGVPENVNKALMYNRLEASEEFVVSLCAMPAIDSAGQLQLYFTSDENNDFFVRVLVLNEDGDRIGETGLLNPGEYVEYVTLDPIPDAGAKLTLKVLSYEPETYYSKGTFNAGIMVQPAENLSAQTSAPEAETQETPET